MQKVGASFVLQAQVTVGPVRPRPTHAWAARRAHTAPLLTVHAFLAVQALIRMRYPTMTPVTASLVLLGNGLAIPG